MGASYEVADENVCVEYLTVEKNALARRQRCFKEKVNLTGKLSYLLVMLRKTTVNTAFHI